LGKSPSTRERNTRAVMGEKKDQSQKKKKSSLRRKKEPGGAINISTGPVARNVEGPDRGKKLSKKDLRSQEKHDLIKKGEDTFAVPEHQKILWGYWLQQGDRRYGREA